MVLFEGLLKQPVILFSIPSAAILAAMLLNSSAFSPLTLLTNLSVATAPIVTNPTTRISYHGTQVNDVEHFQNIFYAQDTSGSRRFTPPAPYIPRPGSIVDATSAGAWCPQAEGGPPLPFTSPIHDISENCLSLRIARPTGTTASAKLPVIVYLHGGGDALGSASDQLYTPDGMVSLSKANDQPIIYVGINYRLGVFGFAANKALKSARQMNLGLRDQRLAFEWIRDNIPAFGGDSGNVVAVGQSVGAMAVGLHLVSFGGSQGVPFQKAIMMSGSTGTTFNIMSDYVADNTAEVARGVGCGGFNPDSMQVVECMRNVPLEKLRDVSVALARALHPPFGELVFYPSFDGDYIIDRPSELLRKGSVVSGLPIMASWMANDGAWYAQPTITEDSEVPASFQSYIKGLQPASLQHLLQLYPVTDFTHLVRPGEPATAQYYRAAQMNRDLWFTCPVIDFTWQYRRFGHSSNIRLYEMNQTKYTPIFQYMGVPQWRVSHLSDIPYVFNEDVAAGGDNSRPQRELSALLSGSFAAFAHSGDPTIARAGKSFNDWPVAYGDHAAPTSFSKPDTVELLVIDGAESSGPAVAGLLMNDTVASGRQRGVDWEKIVERCNYINSILDEIGV